MWGDGSLSYRGDNINCYDGDFRADGGSWSGQFWIKRTCWWNIRRMFGDVHKRKWELILWDGIWEPGAIYECEWSFITGAENKKTILEMIKFPSQAIISKWSTSGKTKAFSLLVLVFYFLFGIATVVGLAVLVVGCGEKLLSWLCAKTDVVRENKAVFLLCG